MNTRGEGLLADVAMFMIGPHWPWLTRIAHRDQGMKYGQSALASFVLSLSLPLITFL